MPPNKRDKFEGLQAIHSARLAYSPDGMYGEREEGRSMNINSSAAAMDTQTHPLVQTHPETGELGFFGTAGYVIGIVGVSDQNAEELLMELHEWQIQPQFQYRHQWQEKMLIMWDNRSLLHRATGGFQGHARLLHRTTIGAAAH
jgi:taurine dioxygenase